MSRHGKQLLDLEAAELEELAVESGYPKFRGRQLLQALHQQRPGEIAALRPLPKQWLETLAKNYRTGIPEVAERHVSIDGTTRYLLSLGDGKTVESVFIPEEDRDTLCISSQVGCPVDCRFCLTALLGLERNLSAGEIAGQVLRLRAEHGLDPQKRQLNVVLMGMGEPLLNLDNVLKAVRMLTHDLGAGLSQRRITVSTSGLIPKIRELGAAEVRPKLAISLNASNEEQRQELMPITRKWHLDDLIAACGSYPLRPWERLTFEYVLLGGVNDTPEDARRVVGLVGALRCHVNLIPFNPGGGLPFKTPDPERVAQFQEIVSRRLPCFVRRPRGRDIFAACGQLKRTADDPQLTAV